MKNKSNTYRYNKKIAANCFFILLIFGLILHLFFHEQIIAFSDGVFDHAYLPPPFHSDTLPEISIDNLAWVHQVANIPIVDLGESFIFDIDFSTDGRFLALSSPGEKIEVWDNQRHIIVFATENNPGPVAINQDGNMIAWEMRADPPDDEYIVFTALPSGMELARFDLEKGGRRIDNLQFSSNSEWLVFSKNNTTNILDIETGNLLHQVQGRPFDLSPNGEWLAVASGRTITIYSIQDSEVIPVFEIQSEKIVEQEHIKFNPSSTALAVAGNQEVAVVSLNDNVPKWTSPFSLGHSIWGLDFSPDGRLLAIANQNTTLLSLDPPAAPDQIELLQEIDSQPSRYIVFEIATIAFHPNGKLLLVSPAAGSRNKLETWGISTLDGIFQAYLFILGSTLATFGYWYIVIFSFRKRIWHGVLILVGTPLIAIIYGLFNFSRTKSPLVLLGLGMVIQIWSIYL